MKRDAANTSPSRSRSRKKAVPPAAEATAPATDAVPTPADSQLATPAGNVGALEGGLSLALGVLFVVGALFPRSLRQLLLLGIGSGLVYRGVTHRCGIYAALGIDTAKEPLLKQINEKYLAPAAAR